MMETSEKDVYDKLVFNALVSARCRHSVPGLFTYRYESASHQQKTGRGDTLYAF